MVHSAHTPRRVATALLASLLDVVRVKDITNAASPATEHERRSKGCRRAVGRYMYNKMEQVDKIVMASSVYSRFSSIHQL
jgi:hypothetical protein